jgi:acid phosphatase
MAGITATLRAVTLVALLSLVEAGCGSGPARRPADIRVSLPAGVVSRPVTKVMAVIEENHSLDQVRTGMPYTFNLAKRFGYATDYHAVTNHSLPNYLALVSGSTYGVTDDQPPAAHRLRGPTVFGDALARGETAAVYAEGMPHRCATANGGDQYVVRHNPWTYFVDERAACRKHDVPASALSEDIAAGRLPNLALVVPNMCHDAHDCDLTTADIWFERLMRRVFAGPDWRSGHLAIVLTFDENGEDDPHQHNPVLTVVVHPSQHHRVVGAPLSHYSVARLLEDVVGAPHRGQAAHAPSMSKAFHLPVSG